MYVNFTLHFDGLWQLSFHGFLKSTVRHAVTLGTEFGRRLLERRRYGIHGQGLRPTCGATAQDLPKRRKTDRRRPFREGW